MTTPDIATLVRRLTETPGEMLMEPRISPHGVVDVAAVVGDLIWAARSGAIDPAKLEPLVPRKKADTGWQRLVLIAAWLLHDPSFLRAELADAMLGFLCGAELRTLAEAIDASLFVTDPDRREELARRALAALGILPAGETAERAADRLAALDSLERRRVIDQAAVRAREVREAMARRAAEAAAAKASRE